MCNEAKGKDWNEYRRRNRTADESEDFFGMRKFSAGQLVREKVRLRPKVFRTFWF